MKQPRAGRGLEPQFSVTHGAKTSSSMDSVSERYSLHVVDMSAYTWQTGAEEEGKGQEGAGDEPNAAKAALCIPAASVWCAASCWSAYRKQRRSGEAKVVD